VCETFDGQGHHAPFHSLTATLLLLKKKKLAFDTWIVLASLLGGRMVFEHNKQHEIAIEIV
jgi:hypothetical protein